MKRLMIGLTVFGLVAAVFAMRHNSASAQVGTAALVRNVNISFDGYCDGLTAKILFDKIVRGNQTCCLTSAVKGKTFTSPDGNGFYVIDTVLDSEWDIYETGALAGEFYVYTYPGGEYLNNGTWSPGAACRAGRGGPSTGE
jgi:hypothetical protein